MTVKPGKTLAKELAKIYADGLSMKQIADQLNQCGLKTRNGLEWNRTRLQSFFYNHGINVRKGKT
jgi:hypothetical protein